MPAKTIRALSDAALQHGLPPTIPAIAVYNATRTNELVIEAEIATLPDRMEASGATGPVIVLIGKAMLGAEANWTSLWGNPVEGQNAARRAS
jgi:uroporphyrin-III C-methyltransferase/precorrin-2 dehydrogenase/sirohydrochlorin ferrochelatase